MVVREDGDDEDGVGKRCASKQASGTYNVKSREGEKKKKEEEVRRDLHLEGMTVRWLMMRMRGCFSYETAGNVHVPLHCIAAYPPVPPTHLPAPALLHSFSVGKGISKKGLGMGERDESEMWKGGKKLQKQSRTYLHVYEVGARVPLDGGRVRRERKRERERERERDGAFTWRRCPRDKLWIG